MSPGRANQPRPNPPSVRTVALAAVLSVVAILVSAGALVIVLTQGNDRDPCRSLAWGAVPAETTLPTGWALASSRFFVDNASLTLVGPAPSDAATGATVFVSVSCYGSDAKLALAKAREAAIATGAIERPIQGLGDEALAMVSESIGTTVYVRRGDLVADVTAPDSVAESTLEALLFAVDTAMSRAFAAGPSTSTAAQVALGSAPPTASPVTSQVPGLPSDAASPNPTPVSHVAPDLEARLPGSVDGTSLAIDSVTGATALDDDVTSKALIASLGDLDKTPSDLQIARALDPAGQRQIRVYAFRVVGADGADLVAVVVNALLANTAAAPEASQVTVGGVPVTKLSYGEGPAEYVFGARDGVVFNVETTDESLAITVLRQLH
jgi:hypothetical protein